MGGLGPRSVRCHWAPGQPLPPHSPHPIRTGGVGRLRALWIQVCPQRPQHLGSPQWLCLTESPWGGEVHTTPWRTRCHPETLSLSSWRETKGQSKRSTTCVLWTVKQCSFTQRPHATGPPGGTNKQTAAGPHALIQRNGGFPWRPVDHTTHNSMGSLSVGHPKSPCQGP